MTTEYLPQVVLEEAPPHTPSPFYRLFAHKTLRFKIALPHFLFITTIMLFARLSSLSLILFYIHIPSRAISFITIILYINTVQGSVFF